MKKYEDLIPVGLIKELEWSGDYPSIKTLIHKPMKEKEAIVQYLKEGKNIGYAPAIVRDVLNPEIHLPYLAMMSDGKYKWRSDLIYYVEKYDMELPQEFIDHALAQIQAKKAKQE